LKKFLRTFTPAEREKLLRETQDLKPERSKKDSKKSKKKSSR
jgi:hypothetical protein